MNITRPATTAEITGPVKVLRHGIDCPKVDQLGEGYLHEAHDDMPYDVDGVMYCGRCHGWVGK